MSHLTPDDVRKVAELAQLEIAPESLEAVATQLSGILDYVEILGEVNTEGVEPLAHPLELVNVFRDDEPTEMLPRELALKNAPKTDGKYFIVPAILEGGD
ncbi:MAG: Asp-tRNA(Asn)/Glu-tRNA(Gln) amidotransferase subunit GatC [Planctomycetaceae bacterium]